MWNIELHTLERWGWQLVEQRIYENGVGSSRNAYSKAIYYEDQGFAESKAVNER